MYLSLPAFVAESVFSFGIRLYIWIYQVMAYLDERSGQETSNPGLRLFFCLICPLYMVWWVSQTAKRIDLLEDKDGNRSNLVVPCTIYALVGGALLAAVIMQKRINFLEKGAEAASSREKTNDYPAITTRSGIQKLYVTPVILILHFLSTFGVYHFFWLRRMTEFLNGAEEFEKRNPKEQVLLCFLFPPYTFYWIYESAARLDAICAKRGIRSDLIPICSIYSCLTFLLLPACLMQEKVNQIVLDDYAAEHGSIHSKYDVITQVNTHYYTFHFNKTDELRSRVDWNWMAFFLDFGWLLYRRLYLWGLLSLLSDFIALAGIVSGFFLDYSTLFSFGIGLLIIPHLFWGFFANHIYKERCEVLLKQGTRLETEQERKILYARKGGVSVFATWVSILSALMIFSCGLLALSEQVEVVFPETGNKISTYFFFKEEEREVDPYFLSRPGMISLTDPFLPGYIPRYPPVDNAGRHRLQPR